MFCQTLSGLLAENDCRSWIEVLEGRGFVEMAGDYPASYRDNDRLILDHPELAARLFSQLRSALPQELHRDGRRWTLSALNSRFRSCRYRGGQAFCRHRDGAHSQGADRRSLLTLMLYLNGAQDFQGGSTRFYPDRWSEQVDLQVQPEAGLGIVFDHALWHDGEPVTLGTKYVLRTDVMYETEEPLADGHTGYVFDLIELPDGRLASASRDQTVRVWANGKVDRVLRHHKASVTRLCWAGNRLWSGSRDREIAIWNQDLSLQTHFPAHEGTVLALLPLANGLVASSGAGGQVCLWDQDGHLRGSHSCGHWPWALLQLANGDLLVGDDTGDICRLRPGHQAQRFCQASCAVHCLLESDGIVLAGGGDGRIHRWQGHGYPLSPWTGHRGPVTSLLPLPEGRLLSGSEDDGVRIWDSDGTSLELLRHHDFVRSLCLVEGGARLASGSYDGSVRWTRLSGPSSPVVMALSERAAKPGGASSGTAAAIW